jgi:AcrR family transcriptional regulator
VPEHDPDHDASEPSTRARILATARDLFERHGYENTSLRQIAEQLALTKTAVLYHFATKAHLIEALAEPLVDDLVRAVDAAVSANFETQRWQVCSAILEVYLAHRKSLQLLLRDLSLLARAPLFARFVAVMTEANRLVAGPRPALAARVRAAQAIALLSDPVILLADAPTPALRREVLSGLARLLGAAPAARRRAATRKSVGRPTAMSAEFVAAAHRLRRQGKRTMAQIAAELGVSRATLYRYF